MEASKDAPAGTSLANTNTPSRRLIALLRDPGLAPLLHALLMNEINQLRGISPAYFTYELEGDEVIINDEDLDTIIQILRDATCRPELKAVDVVLPELEGQICKQLQEGHRDAVISAMFDLFLNEDLGDQVSPAQTDAKTPLKPGEYRLVRQAAAGRLTTGDLLEHYRLGEVTIIDIHAAHTIDVMSTDSEERCWRLTGLSWAPNRAAT